jgi:hypothetical protein
VGRLTVVVLAFASLSLRALCEDAAQADTELGLAAGQALRRRVADLRAATSPSDLIVGKPCVVHDGNHEVMSLSLDDDFRVKLVANHAKNPRTTENQIDWAKVSRIKIVEIAR